MNKTDLIYLAIIAVLIFTNALTFNFWGQCHNNSFVYGAKTVKEATGIEIECSCYAQKTLYSFDPVHFNSSNVWTGEKYDFLE